MFYVSIILYTLCVMANALAAGFKFSEEEYTAAWISVILSFCWGGMLILRIVSEIA